MLIWNENVTQEKQSVRAQLKLVCVLILLNVFIVFNSRKYCIKINSEYKKMRN